MPHDTHFRRRLLRLHSKLDTLRRQVADIRTRRALERRYDPNQPRAPAGTPGGGRWATGETTNGDVRYDQEVLPEGDRAKLRSSAGRMTLAGLRTLAECEEQYKRDGFQCKLLRSEPC